MAFSAVSFWMIFIKTAALPAAMGVRKVILKKWKKMKKVVDKQKERWYYKPRCWGNALKQRLSRRSLKRLPVRQQKKKNEKVEKSSWQTANDMIWYQSCSGEEITKINKRTLITEQWNNLEKFLKVLFFKELTFKNSKKGKIAKQLFWPNQTLYQRVWSWLRMNAGGVLNTCKSNEEF